AEGCSCDHNDQGLIFENKNLVAAVSRREKCFVPLAAYVVSRVPEKVTVKNIRAIRHAQILRKRLVNPTFGNNLFAAPPSAILVKLTVFGEVECAHLQTTRGVRHPQRRVLPFVSPNPDWLK